MLYMRPPAREEEGTRCLRASNINHQLLLIFISLPAKGEIFKKNRDLTSIPAIFKKMRDLNASIKHHRKLNFQIIQIFGGE